LVYQIHSIGSILFAATSAGVYSSEDQGKTCQTANNGFERVINSSITILRGFSSLFISAIEVTALASVTAADKTYLFAAQTNSKVYRSVDLGKKWEPVEGLPQLTNVYSLGANGTTLFAGVVSLGFPSPERVTVYRSTDQGKSWTPASKGLPVVPPFAFASIGSNIFAAFSEGIFTSSNNGESWTSANGGLPEKIVLSTLSASGSNIYVGSYGKGVYVSTNNGQNWTAINSTLPQDAIVTALFANGSNLFVITPTEYDATCPAGG